MADSRARRTFARAVLLVLCCLGVLASCAKDPLRVDRNRPPRTFLVAAPAESASASYKIHLYWRGEDSDGFVSGFLWSWDDSTVGAFRFTTKTDSTFELDVNDSLALVSGTGQQQPGQTRPHTFFIRAVDNLGKADPQLTIFNRRVYNANTERPVVRFVGPIPIGTKVDTLCDAQPFKICWSGSDADGYVAYYRWDVGVFSSPLQKDTCAVFNDPGTPGSVPLVSGVYTMTVTAVDNAFARSDPATGGRTLLVVNHDPETQILGTDTSPNTPIGHYLQPFENGAVVNRIGTFAQGDTVPFRSTVWWNWTGSDAACNEPDIITGWSAVLRGTRNGGDPYIIGFRDFLCINPSNQETIRFTSNDPARVANICAFQQLVLDSLDAGYNMLFNVASRDSANRADGTPASFLFNCNFPPHVDSLKVETVTLTGGELAKRISWQGVDREDGFTKGAKITLDSSERIDLNNYEQEIIIPESRLKVLSSENPHTVEVRVRDRANILSDQILSTQFSVTYP